MIKYTKKLSEEESSKIECIVPLIEFFMLCTSRHCDTKNKKTDKETDKETDLDYYDPTYRKTPDVVHNKPINPSTGNLLFDLGAFFYNVTCMDECYKRFGNEGKALLDFAKMDTKKAKPVTLYGNLHSLNKNDKSWLYGVAIRNMDVLWNLVHKANNIEGSSSNIDVLSEYLKLVQKNKLRTYESTDIDFDFCSVISDMLEVKDQVQEKKAECKKERISLFNDIYSPIGLDEKTIIEALSSFPKEGHKKSDVFDMIESLYSFVKKDSSYKKIYEEFRDKEMNSEPAFVLKKEVSKWVKDINKQIKETRKENKNKEANKKNKK